MIMFTLTAVIHSLRPSQCVIGSYTCETPSNFQYAVIYMTLLLAALGVGGTRFTIATMGAEQFDKASDQGIFFNWYFLTLYIANAISFSAIVYIQDNVSWGLGFGICAIANVIGLAVFIMGKKFYCQVKPKGSPFTSIARVMVAAIRKRKILRSFGSHNYYFGTTEALKMEDDASMKSLRFLNRAALITEDDKQLDGYYARSWRLCTMEEVEALKTLIKLIPLWSTGIFLSTSIGIPYSLITLQALTLNRHIGPHFKFPAGSFILFNFLATAISIFIVDRFFTPMWRNLTHQPLTPIQRIGIGHVINILGLVGYALMEIRRLHVVRTHNLTNQPSLVVPMSAFWLVVPLAIVGIGEGFHFPGSVALYYQEFPISLKSMSTAMVSLLLAIGFFLSSAIIDLVKRTSIWLPDDINVGRVDNVYWMLTVIGVVNFGYYIICAKLFKYQNIEEHDGDSRSAP
ncbi:protein NRT1/ PTR FAMILY 2.6-like isoform X3 [Quercus lobata]|nr:protein NRT1/ PTR FAMILY 2.6-like isoform X3 [Quercus lobata]XP_030931390.1 protein NRT1/ PTR FAMILY 2.6-like isoform X3 [Quercus lobata]